METLAVRILRTIFSRGRVLNEGETLETDAAEAQELLKNGWAQPAEAVAQPEKGKKAAKPKNNGKDTQPENPDSGTNPASGGENGEPDGSGQPENPDGGENV
jgi:hypothetical protein